MSDAVFPYDVFLSHSAKDKAVVRPLAERLRQDGLKVPSHFGFRISGFGFAQPGPFRFRDPLNQERRFIPLRFDEARSLCQSVSIQSVSTPPTPRI